MQYHIYIYRKNVNAVVLYITDKITEALFNDGIAFVSTLGTEAVANMNYIVEIKIIHGS